jgi:hypothetical protein
MAMRRLVGAFFCLMLSLPAHAGDGPPNLNCRTGPVTRSYGGTKWLVYSCDDSASLAMVAAPKSPAAPFTFTFVHGPTGYDLYGKGAGNRQMTDAAYKDLTVLKGSDVRALLAATKKH